MKLSIITINYNNKEGLQRTIDSVLSQTFTDYEWIIIDGGSTDGSKELIEQYQKHFAYWCSEPDKGIYNAMNKGIAHAQGEYLNFMNSGDCFFEKDTLFKVFGGNKSYLSDVLYGNCKYGCQIVETDNPLRFSHIYFSNICHQSTFIKKVLFEDGLYNERLKIVSDWEKWLDWMLKDKKFEHLEMVVAEMAEGGVSANVQQRESERKLILKEKIPYALALDLDEMIARRKRDEWNPELEETYRFLSSRRLYKRLIQWNLSIIRFLSKILKS